MSAPTQTGRALRLAGPEPEAEGDAPASEPDARPGPEVALEVELSPEAAARLPRLPFVSTHRGGRSRGAAAEMVWFDTVGGDLAREGLTVEAAGRAPRAVLRTLPTPQEPWHPGQPPEVLRRLATGEVPPEAGDGPLVAVAAFTGRRLAFRLEMPDGPVEATVLTGRLRAVAAERETARLRLLGPVPAVFAAADGLATALPLLLPRAALAEEGRALASGTEPRPFRLGPPDTSAASTAEDAFLRATGHLLEVLAHHAGRIRPDVGPEPVHQARVGLRRLRSLFRVFRVAVGCTTIRGLDVRFREVLTVLGPARDWDVFLDGTARQLTEAFPDERRIAALVEAAETRRAQAYDDVLRMLAAPAWRQLLLEAVATLLARPWRASAEEPALHALDMPVEAFGRAILERRWHRLRRGGGDFETLSPEALHELRLDGKRLRYAAEVFAPLFGGRAGRRFLRRVSALQDGLGIANDAAVARGLARSLATSGRGGHAWAIGVVEGWCAARMTQHRGDALAAWERLSGKDRFWTEN